jgi:catechol 2,3-dioxygenase-like lactoylglutathione lyase family enzyme
MTLVDARVEARLPAQDLDRARQWYADKLGLHPAEERDGGLMYRCACGVFCLFTSSGAASGAFTQLAFNVDDLEAEVADLQARGVNFEDYDSPDLRTVEGIAPSRGTTHPRAPLSVAPGSATAKAT